MVSIVVVKAMIGENLGFDNMDLKRQSLNDMVKLNSIEIHRI